MSLAIDIAWSSPDPAQIRAKGYSGVLTYISRDASKTKSRAYIDACHAQGLDVGFVFEDSADRARQGAAAGTADGQFVAAHLAALGAPSEVGCYFAVDYAAPASDRPAIVAYFQAAAAAIAPRRAGAYGDADVDDWARAGGLPLEWGTVAWSAGRTAAGIALFQRVQQDFGGAADVDEIRLSDWGQWRAVPLPAPKPLPPPAAPVYGPIYPEDNVQPVTIEVQIRGGHGWCAAPAGKTVSVVPLDLDPAIVNSYVHMPQFAGMTSDNKLVFGPTGDTPVTDGNYGFVVWVIPA